MPFDGGAVYQIADAVRFGTAVSPAASAGSRPAPVRLSRAATRSGETAALLLMDVLAAGGTGGLIALVAGLPLWSLAAPALAVAVVCALAAGGLYRARLQYSALDDLPRIVAAVAGVAAGAGSIAWLTGVDPHGAESALGAATVLAAVVFGRVTAYRVLRRRRRTRPGRAAIVVGAGDVAVRLAEALRADSSYGLTPVGFIGPSSLARPTVPVLAPAGDLERAVTKYKPVHLIIGDAGTPDADLVPALRRIRRRGVIVHVVPRLFELSTVRAESATIRDIPVARLRREPAQFRRWAVKRLLDICGASLGLVLLAPIMAVCALAVRFESRRAGVLFRQERVTRDGQPFTILKFRSLTPSSEAESQLKWNINHDARLGPIGRFLRFSSLDELPQLINVLRGDMSLVGPRPERPFFVEEFQRRYTGYDDRHRVPAGITGWAQIHGLRGDTSIDERVRFDNHYIEYWSLGLDIKIILRTVGSMLSIHRI
jgi:exopolysaccharide biosynthesis polyprenyl glycosylphosphotransferase